MHLNLQKRFPLARKSEEDFVVPLMVDVLCYGPFDNEAKGTASTQPVRGAQVTQDEQVLDEGDVLNSRHAMQAGEEVNEYLVGRIWAEQLDWAVADACRQSILSVCDAVGAVWMEVLETLTRDGGERFRRELQVESWVEAIIFIHEFLIHPAIPNRIAVLDAAIRSAADMNSLVLMHYEQSLPHHLDDWEYRDLGFKKIARSNLLLRDNHLRYPFAESHPGGCLVDFTANAEHEIWVRENWQQLVADHPAR